MKKLLFVISIFLFTSCGPTAVTSDGSILKYGDYEIEHLVINKGDGGFDHLYIVHYRGEKTVNNVSYHGKTKKTVVTYVITTNVVTNEE